MDRRVVIINSPENLPPEWDLIAKYYFQKKEFLCHLHKYNYCDQRYYVLYHNGIPAAGTVVYTLKIDLLTFANIPSPVKMQVIGLPVSVATPPLTGDGCEFDYLLKYILGHEKGFILALNMEEDYLSDMVLNLRTLPTIIFRNKFNDLVSYEKSLRHNYRRRLRKFREKFNNVRSVVTDCSAFTEMHYNLYLEIMKRSKTKLETLSFDFFRNLPARFMLTTHLTETGMLCWNITCDDDDTLFFFFGGQNYSLRDQYQSYHNNIFGILNDAVTNKVELVDLGQTAEIAKSRLGGMPAERRMFIYHRNSLVINLLRIFRGVLSYSKHHEISNVFKTALGTI